MKQRGRPYLFLLRWFQELLKLYGRHETRINTRCGVAGRSALVWEALSSSTQDCTQTSFAFILEINAFD